MNFKKVSALLLTIALIISGCGIKDHGSSIATDAASDTSATETEPLDSLEARKLVSDELPDKDFGNASFTILGESAKEPFLYVEENEGDVVEQAVFNRNRALEERFSIDFNYELVDPYSQLGVRITQAVNSNDDLYQLISGHVVHLGTLMLNGYLGNWCDLEHIDFSKPWWAKATTENLTYNDVCFLAVGDFALSALEKTYCIFFNKRLAEEYKIENPYETVMNGNWTIDYLISITKDIYKDENMNQKEDEGDFYGFITNAGSHANAYLWAFDNPIIAENNEGKLDVVYKSNKINDIVTKIVTMIDDNPGISHIGSTAGGSFAYLIDTPWTVLFRNSQTIFATGHIGASLSDFRDMKDDYGIIPYPKWDETQDEYQTMSDGSHSILAYPVTVGDTEMTGIITEALCAESYKQVVPAYYDSALKFKGTRDNTSIEILDMITENCVYDMGYVYDGFKGASFIIQKLVRASDTNFESYWASNSSAILSRYSDVIEYFTEYGN